MKITIIGSSHGIPEPTRFCTCILVEAGNNQNTLQEVLAAMPYLADAVVQVLERE